jgi:tetratricopeptide (TPR) repeat protein
MVLLFNGSMLLAQPFRCGEPAPASNFSIRQKAKLDSQLKDAITIWKKDTSNADAIIWLGRRQAYIGEYEKAIQTFSKGIALHPGDARLYRHRGHRYITLRCFDKAIADLEKAATIVAGKKDETEPDGQPNAQNIPVSTLHQNIYYHLALAWYCKGNVEQANKVWQQCYAASTNEDSRVSAANWLYLTHRLLGNTAAAEALLATLSPDIQLLENQVYLDILLLHKNKPSPATSADNYQNKEAVQSATWLYGWLMYLRLNGYAEEATAAYAQLMKSGQWASFGYIAAETVKQ